MPLFLSARLLRQRDRLRRLTALLLLSRRETPFPKFQSSLKAVEFPVNRLGGFPDVVGPATESPPTPGAWVRPYTTLGSWPRSTNGNVVTIGPGLSEMAAKISESTCWSGLPCLPRSRWRTACLRYVQENLASARGCRLTVATSSRLRSAPPPLGARSGCDLTRRRPPRHHLPARVRSRTPPAHPLPG